MTQTGSGAFLFVQVLVVADAPVRACSRCSMPMPPCAGMACQDGMPEAKPGARRGRPSSEVGTERSRMQSRPACPGLVPRGMCHAHFGVRNWSKDSGPRRVRSSTPFPTTDELEIKRDRRSGNSYGLSPPDRPNRSGEPQWQPYVALTALLNLPFGASLLGCRAALAAVGGPPNSSA